MIKSTLFKQLISRIYDLYFSINLKSSELEIAENTKCLLLSPHANEEILGCGGTMLQNSAKFDVYCLTNGFKSVKNPELSYEERVETRKKEFTEVMEKLGVHYFHFFGDIDDTRLIMRYDRFKTINISDYDYIFIPNILDNDRDNKAVAVLLNELLDYKPYKKNVKIVLYEVGQALAMPNAFINIESTIEAKMELLKNYKSQNAICNYIDAIRGLNSYRGLSQNCKYAEAYSVLDINEFKKICKVYSV